MSVYFKHDGRSIWNPTTKVGVLFFDQVKAMENLLDMQSGIADTGMDEYTIDGTTFGVFVDALLKQIGESEHEAFIVLGRGVATLALALAIRMTGTLPTVPAHIMSIVGHAHYFATTLPE